MEPHQQAAAWSAVPSAAPPPLPSPAASHNPNNMDNALHQSLASHFHLLHLIENLAEVTESGMRDQHSDALVTELTGHFERCQQLLNSISGTIGSKSTTVEGQKRKVDEYQQILNQRRDLISQYRGSVQDLIKADARKS